MTELSAENAGSWLAAHNFSSEHLKCAELGGYLPTAVYSAHYISDPGLSHAVARFLEEERRHVQGEMDWLAEEFSPFRQAAR